MTNAVDMAHHIDRLCEQHEIAVGSHSSGGRAWKKSRYMKIRPVRSSITYAVALHEIGHILGPWQSQNRLIKEAGAWKWARENALAWTPAMERKMQACLASYLRKAKRAAYMVMPDAEHVFWTLVGEDPRNHLY